MKKIFIVFIIIILTGCSKNYKVCNSSIDNKKQNYHADLTYKIYYKNNFVTSVEISQKYTSTDQNMINYFDNYLKLTYVTLNEQYGYITYERKQINNGIEYDAKFDYTKIDINEMVKNGYIDKDYVVNKRISLSGITKMYEKKGAVCK